MKNFFTLLLTLISINVFSQSTTVVISQVYGGGGATSGTPTYKSDYVELYNKSTSSQDISGFQIMYGSATGQFGSSATAIFVIPANTTILAGKYLLIQLGTTGTVGANLPVTPDLVTTNISMSASNGKVALVTSAFTGNSCGAAATPCTFPNANFIDWVAYGTAGNGTAGNGEGGTSVNNGVALTSTLGCVRKLNGNQDTDNNNADFDVVTAPVPRNSSSVLPLFLNTFNSSLINKQASLIWNTTNENNVDGFTIERSEDGNTYTKIGFVAAKNTASNSYTYNDVLQIKNATYYRLKITDKDGSFKYSSVIVMNAKSGIKLDIYPNPASNTLVVTHPKASVNSLVKIINIDGKNIFAQNMQNGATQSTIDVSNLIKGNYLVVFENDGARSVIQFVKQ